MSFPRSACPERKPNGRESNFYLTNNQLNNIQMQTSAVVIAKESRLVGTTAAIFFPVISTEGLPTAGRSGEIRSRM